MASINDMVEMAEALRSRSLLAIEDCCVAVRNRNAGCRKCIDVCIADAIHIENNVMTIADALCVGCGGCIAACPTAALVSVDPLEEDLYAEAVSAAEKTSDGTAVIACARMAAKEQGDPDKYVTVPCLARIGEVFLLMLVADGIEEIVLVDGDCSTCKYGKASSAADAAVSCADAFIEALGVKACFRRESAFPESARAKDALVARHAARREFFTQAGSYAKNITMTVAEKAVSDMLHQKKERKIRSLRERLGAGTAGKLPTFVPDRNMELMEALSNIIEAEQERTQAADGIHPGQEEFSAMSDVGLLRDGLLEKIVDTRHFGSLQLNAQSCSGCGMCVMFCPTKALQYSSLVEPQDEQWRYLEFQAVDCTQCRLCSDVCMFNCIEVASAVSLGDLFDFEPQLIAIPRAKKPGKLFDRNY